MDMYSIAQRYAGRFVTVHMYGRHTIIGTVDRVSYNCMLLTDAVCYDDLDGGRWQDEITMSNLEDGTTSGSVETTISFAHIAAITCNDLSIPTYDDESDTENIGADHLLSQTETAGSPIGTSSRLELVVSSSLLSLADESEKDNIQKRVAELRKTLVDKIGFEIPLVRIHDDSSLESDHYEFRIGGVFVSGGFIRPDHQMVILDSNKDVEIEGEQSKEVAFGLPVVWTDDKEQKRRAEEAGLTVVDATTVLTTHLKETALASRHLLLTYEAVATSLDRLSAKSPQLINDQYSSPVAKQRLHRVLCDLLREKVWIGDFERIAEAVAWNSVSSGSHAELLAEIRENIADQILRDHVRKDGKVKAIAFCAELEKKLRDKSLLQDFPLYSHFVSTVTKEVLKHELKDSPVVILVANELRTDVLDTFRELISSAPIVSYREMKRTGRADLHTIVTWASIQSSYEGNPQKENAVVSDVVTSITESDNPCSAERESIDDIREIPR